MSIFNGAIYLNHGRSTVSKEVDKNKFYMSTSSDALCLLTCCTKLLLALFSMIFPIGFSRTFIDFVAVVMFVFIIRFFNTRKQKICYRVYSLSFSKLIYKHLCMCVLIYQV